MQNKIKELGYDSQLDLDEKAVSTSIVPNDVVHEEHSKTLEICNIRKAIYNLNSNSKAAIESITSLVKDTTLMYAEEIVDILIQYTYDGLVTLYIIDSIIKNIGQCYVHLISKRIVELFKSTFIKADISTRTKMHNLRHTWNGILSLHTLLKVDQAIHNIDNAWQIYYPEKRKELAFEKAQQSEVSDISHSLNTIIKKDEDGHDRKDDHREDNDHEDDDREDDDREDDYHEVDDSEASVHTNVQSKDDNQLILQTQTLSSHWDANFDEDNIPSTQTLIDNAVKKEKNMWDGTHGVIKKLRHADVQSNGDVQIDFEKETLASEFDDVIKILRKPDTNKEGLYFNEIGIEELTALLNKKQTNENEIEPKEDGQPKTRIVCDDYNKDDDFVVPRKERIKKWNRIVSDEDNEDFVVPTPKDVKKKSVTERVPKATKKKEKIIDAPCVKAAKRIRLGWIPSDVTYIMSTELFDYITDENQKIICENFKYRKHSIGIEMSKLFPGCIIYVDRYYEAKQFWRIQAYCSHLGCRNYRFIAQYETPNVFKIEFDRPNSTHKKPVSRQLRNYERCKTQETSSGMPSLRRARAINASNKDLICNGDYDGIVSQGVLQKARKEGLAKQDLDCDDIADVEAMQTTDQNTNFISKTLGRNNYGVYIHSKSQHNILHKLHKKRNIDGVPIIGRLDTTGGIARDVTDHKLLYSALTVNIKILNDKKSTPLPLTEQYNVRNTSKDISEWLFNYISTHNGFHENPPLLLDYMVSDFSYANFHAILLSFNRTTLQKYLEVSYNWILFKMENSEFPENFYLWVKIRMCYTHIMHTFGDMTKRHYGKSDSGGQLPQSRVILEILAAMVKATDYNVLLGLFQQMVILLSNQYENDYVQIAALEIKRITSPIEEKLLAPDSNLHQPIDLDELPENCPTLYQSNPFYLQFNQIVDETENIFDEENLIENPYYNPGFLLKFLQRFVPLIPLWSSLLNINKIELADSQLFLLQVYHNQPIECYFGKFKMCIAQQALELGNPPIKLGRAIKLSRELTDSVVSSIDYLIPKSGLNSQLPRKPYKKKCTAGQNASSEVAGDNCPLPAQDDGDNAKNIAETVLSEVIAETNASSEVAGDNCPLPAQDDGDNAKNIAETVLSEVIAETNASSEVAGDNCPLPAQDDGDNAKNIAETVLSEVIAETNASSEVAGDNCPLPAQDDGDNAKNIAETVLSEVIAETNASSEVAGDNCPLPAQDDGDNAKNIAETGLSEVIAETNALSEVAGDNCPLPAQDSGGNAKKIDQNGASEVIGRRLPVTGNQNGGVPLPDENVESADESVVADSAETFGKAKEQYKKRSKTNFNYFKMKRITKIANNLQQQQKGKSQEQNQPSKDTPEVHSHNGLFKNTELYSNYRGKEIIVAKKKGMLLNSSTFSQLNASTPLSPKLMQYIAKALVPPSFQVEFILNGRWSLSLTKKIIFVVSFDRREGHYRLFIINTTTKSFGTVETNNSIKRKYFSKFLDCITRDQAKWTETTYENNHISSQNYNSGIYLIHHILQYIKTSTLEKSMLPPDIMRQNLKEKIITSSENLEQLCLYCGTDDAGDWGKCTKCSRWLHCRSQCANQHIKDIKKTPTYKCPICLEY